MKLGTKNQEKGKISKRQIRFINLILEARWTTEEIIATMKIARRTLAGWRKEPDFRREWNDAIKTLTMRRGSDEVMSGIRAANQEVARIRETGEGEMAGVIEREGAGGKGEMDLGEESAGGSVREVSERERILQRHGEEAALAFDRLIASRREVMEEKSHLAGSDEELVS